jgi:hypothetical protein
MQVRASVIMPDRLLSGQDIMTVSTQDDFELGDTDSEEELNAGSSQLLEEKYKKQMRQIFPQKIELPISTLTTMIKEQIRLDPEFQRRDRWDNNKRSRFIESVVMNVPIPPVFLGEDDYGTYVVLDGRQRLTAINEFLKNNFALEGLKVWSELNGARYSDLELKNLDRTLTRRFIPAVLLLKESSPEVKYDVFDRLNTGGVHANDMEIRNAIFQGPFNKLLHELSENKNFRRAWGIPEDQKEKMGNTLYSQMLDVELVLRFFALQQPALISGRLKDYLSVFMKERNDLYKSNAQVTAADKSVFERAIEVATVIFGEEAFARKSPDGNYRKSAPLADAVLYGLSRLDPSKLTLGDIATLKVELRQMFDNDKDFGAATTSGTNGKGAIIMRTSKTRDLAEKIAPHAVI